MDKSLRIISKTKIITIIKTINITSNVKKLTLIYIKIYINMG